MPRRLRIRATRLLPNPQLLITEPAYEFEALHAALEEEIQPRGIIEQIYVADIGEIVWEIRRLRRCRASIINAAFRTALEEVLVHLLREPGESASEKGDEAEAFALGWFTDPDAKKEVSRLLGQFQLDESAIEAQAIRGCFSDLERIDRMIGLAELRRDEALRCVAKYRNSLAQQLREAAARIIEAKNVLQLEDASSNKSAAAA